MAHPGGKSGRTATVLVFEYVTGGGLVGRDLPPSWASEGAAMRRAIVGDFAAVPSVRVVTTIDPRLRVEAPPGVEVHPNSGGESLLESLAAEADYTLLIAPETDGILAGLTGIIEGIGGRLLGPGRDAVVYLGDKSVVAEFFLAEEVPSPPTLTLGGRRDRCPTDWGNSLVIKPRWGAGSVDTRVLPLESLRSWDGPDWTFVAQPLLVGRPMSASFLIDARGGMHLLDIGRQRIEVDGEGRISYRGGVFARGTLGCPGPVCDALRSARSLLGPGLRGFVGVDYIETDDSGPMVLEINPRPTTSFVAIARRLGPGVVAGAWLDAIDGRDVPLDEGPRTLVREALTFDADGTIHPPEDPSR